MGIRRTWVQIPHPPFPGYVTTSSWWSQTPLEDQSNHTPMWKVLRGLNAVTRGTAPSPELAGGGGILDNDSLPFASLGFLHLEPKMPGQEKEGQ